MMRRSSGKKTGQQVPGSAAVNSSAASNKAVSKETERIDQLFYTYYDKSTGLIGPEGIVAFCADVEVEYTDVRILMLAWRMQAERQGYFTLEEWRRGLKAIRADTISKLKKALPELEKEVMRPQNFLEFYTYSFRYYLTEDKQKSVDINIACEVLDLVLGLKFGPQIDRLGEYLKKQQEYKVVNMDQWLGILRFCKEINFPSLDNYDPDLAWPIILDNFVEWMREQNS
ncbi:DCN1-like protein 4 isoform X2 [Phalaenopsis equestris]|uniref:DCN1-like protein 4 isoform X2 n=1 Tax=Phalaenopsis equestris TaxID=78828 RepID=UPI0009E4551F|nr:DCN1-like protein 4 isoform X2 [Phalaenopsis equestris]